MTSGTQQGIHNFFGDLTGTGPNPVTLPSLSSLTSLLDPSSLTSVLYPSSGTASGTTAMTHLATGLSALAADPAALGSALLNVADTISNVADTISSAASQLYGKLLPTADILNAALISIPAYDVNLFLDGILQAVNGQPVMGLINAVGQPVASDIALYLYLTSLEAAVITNPIESAGPATGVPALGIS